MHVDVVDKNRLPVEQDVQDSSSVTKWDALEPSPDQSTDTERFI